MNIRLLFIFPFSCLIFLSSSAQKKREKNSTVRIKIREAKSGKVTPAMICITNAEGQQAYLPPFGKRVDKVSDNDVFFEGVEFNPDKNWVGPVRKTLGKGNNKDRSVLYGLNASLPYWRDSVMYQSSGDFSIVLNRGKWYISIQHGNEYIPLRDSFEISGKASIVDLSFELKRWIDLPQIGWFSGDVHVHHPTNKSGFREYLLAYARAEDLHLVNILEMGHHQTGVDAMGHVHEGTDFKQAGFGEKFRVNDGNYWLVSGQEDPRSRFGHIIGLNIDQLVRDSTVYDYYDVVFKNLKMQPGALIGFAHFAWNVSWNAENKTEGFPWFITTNDIDFVELLQFLRLNTLDYYDYLNLGFKITAAAGSDFPWASTIGEVRTMVYTGSDFTPDSWFSGLKAGHTFVTNGPALFLRINDKLPGDELNAESKDSIHIVLNAFSHPNIGAIEKIAIYNNEGLVAESVNSSKADSLSISIKREVVKSQWIAAVATCDNGAVAHTTPVYVVVEGKPTYDRLRAPAIIDRQIDYIDKQIGHEQMEQPADQGLIQRLLGAKSFYSLLKKQILEKENK